MAYDYGRFVWFELLTNDRDLASRFYGEVIGWKVRKVDMGGGFEYPMFTAGEVPVCGIADPFQSDSPAQWVSYVSVEDVDRVADSLVKLGGTSMAPAMDLPTVGRMMHVQDPHGAPFFLFRGETKDSDAPTGEGSFHWNELLSPDPEAAVTFYEKAFGYKHETMDMGLGPYFVLSNEGGPRGGVMRGPDGAPPHWLQYVTVSDCDETVARARRAGGTVLTEAMDVPGVGRLAVLRDPMQSSFGVITPPGA